MKTMYLFLVLYLPCVSFAFDWQGHRGARGLYPEDTIGSMEEALKYPVTTLELDVVISKDKKVVVGHDPWINPEICHGNKKNIYEMNYDEIQHIDCGSKPHPEFPQQQKVNVGRPLLSVLIKRVEEVLKNLKRNIVYSVEIKSTQEDEEKGLWPDYKSFTDLVLKELRNQLHEDRFIIQSFDWRVLKYIKEKNPDIRVAALSEKKYLPQEVIKELNFKPDIFSPDYKLLTVELVRAFHEQGIKVIPWTVNTVPDMQGLMKMGVDGIITDYPNLIPKALAPECLPKHNLFEGRCVKLPAHALPSDQNPGWVCKDGHIQKRKRCIRVPVPRNAHLLPDGKNWACKEGFIRYRGSCKAAR